MSGAAVWCVLLLTDPWRWEVMCWEQLCQCLLQLCFPWAEGEKHSQTAMASIHHINTAYCILVSLPPYQSVATHDGEDGDWCIAKAWRAPVMQKQKEQLLISS